MRVFADTFCIKNSESHEGFRVEFRLKNAWSVSLLGHVKHGIADRLNRIG